RRPVPGRPARGQRPGRRPRRPPAGPPGPGRLSRAHAVPRPSQTTEGPGRAGRGARAPPGRAHRMSPGTTQGRDTGARAAARIEGNVGACRVRFSPWLGVTKGLTREQKTEAARQFGADTSYVSAAKKLFDTKDDAYRAVTEVRNEARGFWFSKTLPYVE